MQKAVNAKVLNNCETVNVNLFDGYSLVYRSSGLVGKDFANIASNKVYDCSPAIIKELHHKY